MISRRELLAGTAAVTFSGPTAPLAAAGKGAMPQPPITPRILRRIEQLGRVRIDDFAWLKPANWKEVWRDPASCPAHSRLSRRRKSILRRGTQADRETAARAGRGDEAARCCDCGHAAGPDGPWAYFTRFAAGAQHPTFLRTPRGGGSEEVLLDAERLARGKPYLAIRNAIHSPDHRLFAWAEDANGAEKFVIRVKDLATGEVMKGPSDAFGDFVFSADSKHLVWVWRDPNSRPRRLYRRLARGGADALVYEEQDPGFLMEISRSASGDWLFLRSFNDVTGEVRIIDAHKPESQPVLVAQRTDGVNYSLEHWRDRFVMRTNADGAEDFKLAWTPTSAPMGPWRDWVPERPGRTITELQPRMGDFAWLERIEGNLHILTCGIDGVPREPAPFSEAAYVLAVQPSEYSDNALWITIELPRMPPRWMRVDLATGAQQFLGRAASGCR